MPKSVSSPDSASSPEQQSTGASLPELQAALAELAYNLRWSWHEPTQELFSILNREAWRTTQNPVLVLRALADDPDWLAWAAPRILAERAGLRRYLAARPPLADAPRVAYLSAEFGLAEALPIYSGGLGVLAGDHLKAASSLGLPLTGVGLLYRYGYFQQALDESGYQRERYDALHFEDLPIRPVVGPDGGPLTVTVPFPGRLVHARAWLAQVGRVPLYLLDTDIPENREDDRWITAHLYGGDQDTRIRQELVLGIGGARLLHALGSDHAPAVYHMNEGHSAFVTLELARERLAAGQAASFDEALLQMAPHVVFTTHTPVPAGHDAFPSDLVEAYFSAYRPELGLTHEEFMNYGRRVAGDATERFTMTVLALRSAARRNGVSQLHGEVSRSMWADVGLGIDNAPPILPMSAITNGVHTPTWVGDDVAAVFDAALGDAWRAAPEDPAHWRRLTAGDPGRLWRGRTAQRARLLRHLDRVSRREGFGGLAPGITAENALVIGFARRFATYKRAWLLLADPDRLERLLRGNPDRPVVIVFAGKAHPRDEPGKALVQRVVQASRDERFRGRLLFLENYDVAIAGLMVQGADVWLNTPKRPMEASGTSGMKATLNGALHLSELDGWWDEAYRDDLGWALGVGAPEGLTPEEEDAFEARQLMDLLESQVVPLFYERAVDGLPSAWLGRVARSIQALAPAFSASRMVAQYAEQMYVPAGTPTRIAVAR